jgi:hypothetical protein
MARAGQQEVSIRALWKLGKEGAVRKASSAQGFAIGHVQVGVVLNEDGLLRAAPEEGHVRCKLLKVNVLLSNRQRAPWLALEHIQAHVMSITGLQCNLSFASR